MSHILVVDDDPDILLLLCTILRSDNHTVERARGGREALEAIRRRPPFDLIILDVQMPDVDGWEVLQSVRADAHLKHSVVLLCTVKASDGDLLRGWNLGCDGYVTKPFDIAHLAEEVRRVVGLAQEERILAREQGKEAASRMQTTRM